MLYIKKKTDIIYSLIEYKKIDNIYKKKIIQANCLKFYTINLREYC